MLSSVSMWRSIFTLALLVLASHAFSTTTTTTTSTGPTGPTGHATTTTARRGSSALNAEMNRMAFLQQIATVSVGAVSVAAVAVAGVAPPALAKEVDPAIKGTKDDPKYQACVSQCMYECTKPKGGEQMSRSECIPGCKKQCATSKSQLMIGTPLK
eukprot:CAMPEP_0198291884 /NCGR_PEP_ID=MMETSP1449-20131203/9240_1 /TAXON_ID=420275 /ORGANISM="Attheya septentrionalis, Strain CCMP2084" /LENGTH=155 /DNA_ID=CAMNT_0043990569 /DNA_START=194 /DNA_END=661 /DNA_ORIENTATION=+